MVDDPADDMHADGGGILYPVPSFQAIKDVAREYERGGRQYIEFPMDTLQAVIRCFVNATPFDRELYLRHNRSLATLHDQHHHWIYHGYFEGRLMYGWEKFPFEMQVEMLHAPQEYYRALRAAALATEARCYYAAERHFIEAIELFQAGIAARFGLAELLFRLRRPLDSEAVLMGALEREPGSTKANELLIDVLVDLGQQDMACSVSLRSGCRANSALQVLRLLGRGALAIARRQVAVASDDWPVLQNLRERIKNEWREERARLRHLHNVFRQSDVVPIASKIELARCLARLGFTGKSMKIARSVMADDKDRGALWSTPEHFQKLARVVTISEGAERAIGFLKEAPPDVASRPDLRRALFRLAYQAGDHDTIAAMFGSLQEFHLTADMLETFAYALLRLRRFDDAIEICKRSWISISENRWLPAVVLQIGRLQSRYSGVSLDDDPGVINYSNRIPRRIMQFWDKATPPDDVRCLISEWATRNPGFQHVLFCNETAIDFLRNTYNEDYVRIFNYCHHPAMAADFFRLAYLTAVGGVYIDADEYCNQTIETLVSAYPARDLFASISEGGFFVNNRFLCSSPGHPYLRAVLNQVVHDMLAAMEAKAKPDIWFATGPFQYSRVFAELLLADNDAAREVIGRIGLVYTHELTRYVSVRPLGYKSTKEGNWRAS